ncbi:hypothetical protein BDP27DRAFT_1446428 [Rhodocollybia butyracea]|uniref:Uncharacterized protein n=1 Tax=Rhodocollybia butyracea TaxID=206335 RepID=A0A9P5U9U1_9AGAR|nr:hypothetical protein BDP27DRAFT_1446428 [Rhodocollybia butyracea]
MPLPITSLTSSSKVEKLKSIEDFRLFDMRGQFLAREYWWGLEPGDINIDSPLNKVSVRSDIAHLLSEDALTLVPSPEIINTMLELTLYNYEQSKAVPDGSSRRRCFEVLSVQPYTYKLMPGHQKKKLPLFMFDSSTNTVQRFDHPYTDLPSFTLDCYPFYTVMHTCFALPHEFQSEPQDIPLHRSIFSLTRRWRYDYPKIGKFSLPPEIAADMAALFGNSDSESESEPEPESDSSSLPVKGLAYTPGRKVESWLQTVQPETPVGVICRSGFGK